MTGKYFLLCQMAAIKIRIIIPMILKGPPLTLDLDMQGITKTRFKTVLQQVPTLPGGGGPRGRGAMDPQLSAKQVVLRKQ